MQKKQENLNPIFKKMRLHLGSATFYSLFLLLDEIDAVKDNQDGTGLVSGNLAQDLGPLKADQNVVFRYNKDSVIVEVWDEELEEDAEVYKFRVILEKPTIIENKKRMK